SGHAERIELHVAVPKPHTKYEVAAGDDIERGHGLGRVYGIVQVEEQDAEANGHLASFGRQSGKERYRLQLLVVALVQIVLSRQQRVPAAIARVPHHGELLIEGTHHVGLELLLVRDKEAYSHAILLPYSLPSLIAAEKGCAQRLGHPARLLATLGAPGASQGG